MGNDPSYFKGPRRPVEQVSWDDAMQFCETLTAIGHRDGWLPENWKFTLPTEAQWEYACRAGTDTPFSYGSSSDASKMNFDGYNPNKGVYRRTVDVGSLGYCNQFGLYDMHGNVFEWCLDYYGAYTTGSVRDPFRATGTFRVMRGGSWYDGAQDCRSAFRRRHDPTNRGSIVGFRLALVEVQ
jgi:formylglycine-generating enzyme required for sulfatase activity